MKTPYTVVLGDRDLEAGTFTVRGRGGVETPGRRVRRDRGGAGGGGDLAFARRDRLHGGVTWIGSGAPGGWSTSRPTRRSRPDRGCVFCAALEGDEDGERILRRDEHAFVTLAKYPYNPGHLLVLPVRHVGELEELTAEENAGIAVAAPARRAARSARPPSPHGFNVGLNLGRVAGAGIPEHLHWHVVPRWGGDTNFMPVVGRHAGAAGAARRDATRSSRRTSSTDGRDDRARRRWAPRLRRRRRRTRGGAASSRVSGTCARGTRRWSRSPRRATA